MITRLDESMLHQVPLTFAHCEPSDHRFYDRVYVEAVNPAGGTALASGLGVYKNTNVFDGFVSVQHAGKQYNVRLSRALRDDLDSTRVGPLAFEVIEPLRAVRLVVEPGDHPIAADLRWEGLVDPIEEVEHFSRIDGRVQEHVHRYNQVGRASGWVEVEGERIDVADWWAARDHSWGVRPGVGGFEPKTGGMPPQLAGFLYTWVVFSTDEVVGYAQVHENGAGERSTFDGVVRPLAAGSADLRVREVEYEFEFVPGTRLYERARASITTDGGRTWDVRAEPLITPWVMRGTGYDSGYVDRRGLGVYRGPFLLESDVYDLSGGTEIRMVPGGDLLPHFHREHLVRVTVDGAPGTGHFTVLPIGGLPKYGVPPFSAEEITGLMRMSQST